MSLPYYSVSYNLEFNLWMVLHYCEGRNCCSRVIMRKSADGGMTSLSFVSRVGSSHVTACSSTRFARDKLLTSRPALPLQHLPPSATQSHHDDGTIVHLILDFP